MNPLFITVTMRIMVGSLSNTFATGQIATNHSLIATMTKSDRYHRKLFPEVVIGLHHGGDKTVVGSD